MAISKRTLIPPAAAIAAALAAMGGLETMRDSPPAPFAESPHDAFAEGVELKFHEPGGGVAYSLRAVSQTRFRDDSVEWAQPSMHWRESGNVDWQVEAERGFAAPDGNKVRLSGNVVLVRQGGAGDALTLATNLLDVDPDGRILSTGEPVRMTAGKLRQDAAAGLVLDLPEDFLLMLGGVRGSHARP